MLSLNYEELHKLSISNPEKVWDELAKEVFWSKPYTSVIKDKDKPIPKWFVGGEINMSYNCLDKHVLDGFGDDLAIIYECTITNTSEKFTYRQLLTLVELLAGVMVNKCHVQKGDRVLLYFPVTMQGLAAMLACTRIGAIYVVVFSGFAPDLIAGRIKNTEPKLVMTTNIAYEPGTTVNYKEQIEKAVKICQFTPSYCIVYNRPNTTPAKMVKGKDLDWETEIKIASPQAAVPLDSNHPMFINYTSGTTGEPKGFVMGTGNSVVTDKYLLKYVGGLKRKECFWMLSDFGWISGQTLMTYGPLLVGCSLILFEGKPVNKPASAEVAEIINKYDIVNFGTAPTVFRVFRKMCPEAKLKLPYKHLKGVYVGGEVSDTELRQWISSIFSCPVFNLWGQSELGPVAIGPMFGFKRQNYDINLPLLTVDIRIINSDTGEEQPKEAVGRILLKTPVCPSAALTIYKNHQRFLKSYFTRYPGYFDTMDYGMLMNDGSLQVLSRSDDVIHISAIRICGGAFEEICLQNEHLLNAAVVPMDDPQTGQIPMAFLETKKDHSVNHSEVIASTIDLVNKKIGAFACFKNAVIVPELPKNKTGKILRYSLSEMVNGKIWKIPVTIDNPHVYKEIYDILIKAGYKATLPSD